MEFDYSEQTDGVESAVPSRGSVSEPLPGGWYPFRVAAEEVVALPSGVPLSRLQLAVKEGEPQGNRRAFVDFFLGSGKSRWEGKNEFQMTSAEFAAERTKVHEKVSGFLKALGVPLGVPRSTTLDRIREQYNTHMWAEREFMGRIIVKKNEEYGDKNKLMEWAPMDDPKRGYAAWITGGWGKKKVEAAMKGGSGSASSNGAGAPSMTV